MTLSAEVAFIRRTLQQCGIALPSGSRFDQLLRVAETSALPSTLRDVLRARQATKDVLEMQFILQTLLSSDPTEHLIATLRKSLKDDVFPIRSAKSADGRNAQAELYAGAILQNAGLSPRKCERPDYYFTCDGRNWALEVKRLQSEKRLEQRVREGFDALGDSRAPGLLFLDTSQALKSEPTRLLITMPGRFLRESWGNRLRRYVQEHCSPEWLKRIRRGRDIRGLVICDHFVVPQANVGWCLHAFTFGIGMDDNNMRRRREWNSVFSSIEGGTATPTNQ